MNRENRGKEYSKRMTRYIRRAAAYVLAGLIGIGSCLYPETAYGKEWGKTDGSYRMADGITVIPKAIARGIDVSHWQQEVDWERVGKDDVSFVMLGTRYKGEADPRFHYNAWSAHEQGIRLGAYIYSYATSVEMAEAEADFVLNLIKDYPISFPVAFDAEDAGTLGTLPPDQVSQIINAFCKKIEDAGYHPMVYSNDYWLKNKLDLSAIKYDIWIARYNVMHSYDNPTMWQATSTGSVDGISTNVDIDFLYKDYASLLPSSTWRTIGGNTYYYKDYLMQKAAWIHDGDGWYYMDKEGSPSKGWLEFPEGTYYLAEDSGKMAIGWEKVDGSWYYLKQSGVMATGWQEVDHGWYYLESDGRMATGWQDIQGERYYLLPSGLMATGWQELDGAKYYLKPSGAMADGWEKVNEVWYYLGTGGQMATGWQKIDGEWYYLNSTGKMETGWQDIGGTWYFLRPSGAMATGWRQIDGAWYYLESSGAMVTGWREIDGKRYYFKENGVMAANMELELNGETYVAGADGSCIKQEEVQSQTNTSEEQDRLSNTGENQDSTNPSVQEDEGMKGPGANL
ncbi:GH25 family lysozyme [Lachnospiraceae bacterium 62-35]